MTVFKLSQGPPTPTFNLLDQIVTILGATAQNFWPLTTHFSASGPLMEALECYGAGSVGEALVFTSDDLTARLDESRMMHLPSGITAPWLGERGIEGYTLGVGQDQAGHSFGSGAADEVFSLGLWFMLLEAVGNAQSLIAKFGTTAANKEEYDLRLDASGQPELELHDFSVPAWEIASSDDAIVPQIWNNIVATYNGVGGASANAGINLYINGSPVSGITLSDNGAYVAMDDTTALVQVGARDAVATPTQVVEGRVALPFITGKELTAAEVASLYSIGKKLIGL